MKNAIILHGMGCGPESYWFPSIKKFLEKQGYSVWAPQLPGAEEPALEKQLPFVLDFGKFTPETILIGHSSGCSLILSILERLPVHVKKAVLVAGFVRPLPKGPNPDPMLQEKYDWEKIKETAKEIVLINSDNDPWGCNDKEGRYIADHTGGKLIVNKGEGHMGSDYFKQPYREFPLLEQLLLA